MGPSLQVVVLLFGLFCPFILTQEVCQPNQGLPCETQKTLVPGSSFSISSKTCQNGNYPKRERCAWYFDVQDCKPSLQCDVLDLKGEGPKCLKDRLRFESENRRKAFCRLDEFTDGFTDEQTTAFLDVRFRSNNVDEGAGFQCTVSCSVDKPRTGCECGVVNRPNRIVGGVETGKNEYPWQVGLVVPNRNLPICGGAILSSTTIITAAHCTVGQSAASFKVTVGEHDVTVDDGQEVFDVCGKLEHPDYDSTTNEHDFAILTLCKPITFQKNVSPICLPTQSGASYDNVLSTVTGWGTLSAGGPQSSTLQEVDVSTIGNTECDNDYGGGIIKNSMICAKDSGKDACQGDSGGPLITKEAGDFYSLIGIVSFGVGCADPDFPGVYARVTDDLTWIKDNIRGLTCPLPRKRRYTRFPKTG